MTAIANYTTTVDNEEKEKAPEEIDSCQSELHKHVKYKAEGTRIRSRVNWYEQGEVSSKYFYGLEKVKYKNKTINALMLDNNAITSDEKKILAEQTKFYKKLYKSNPEVSFMFENINGLKFSGQERDVLDADFTFEDFTSVLKSMSKGKALGNDGLGSSIYVVMWSRIGQVLWAAVQKSKKLGILYRSARRGVISLIPKRTKNRLYLCNWRPLMLLNTDHKIITKMLTNRLKALLPKIIGTQQTGYVPGHFICNNVWKMIDI